MINMGYYPKNLEFDCKRGFRPTETISTMQFFSPSLERLIEKILKNPRLFEKTKNKFRKKYKIVGTGKNAKKARIDFYLKLYNTYTYLKKRKTKTKPEEEIMELLSKYIIRKENLSKTS